MKCKGAIWYCVN